MLGREPTERGRFGLSVLLSLVVHAAVVAALIAAPQRQLGPVPPVIAVDIEFLPSDPADRRSPSQGSESAAPSSASPAPGEAEQGRPAQPSSAKPGTRERPLPPADEPPTQPARHYVTAKQMLSAAALADPRSRGMRAALEALAEPDRVEQLCALEATSQIAAWSSRFKPDNVVASVLSDAILTGDLLVAEGAALHSDSRWIALAFRCALAADRRRVVAFAFSLGQAIPRARWEDLNLPAGTGEAE